jgi:hypothetical protein
MAFVGEAGDQIYASTSGDWKSVTTTIEQARSRTWAKISLVNHVEFSDRTVAQSFIPHFRRRLSSGADESVNYSKSILWEPNLTSVTFELDVAHCYAWAVWTLGFWSTWLWDVFRERHTSVPSRSMMSTGKVAALESVQTVAVYDPSDGAIRHLDQVLIFEGARPPERDSVSTALSNAERSRHDLSGLETLTVSKLLDMEFDYRVDPASRTLVAEPIPRTGPASQ